MLTLYSYPTLFGVADNNGYGLKVFAFLKLAGVPFRHQHVFDASKAPRSQLPYIVDGDDTVGDSETILAYVTRKYRLTIDAALTPAQRTTNLLITRMLDDLYWVMSYSRWKDDRYWHTFRVPCCASIRACGRRKAKADVRFLANTTRYQRFTILMPRWRAGSLT
jgi:glutathione S-transferase